MGVKHQLFIYYILESEATKLPPVVTTQRPLNCCRKTHAELVFCRPCQSSRLIFRQRLVPPFPSSSCCVSQSGIIPCANTAFCAKSIVSPVSSSQAFQSSFGEKYRRTVAELFFCFSDTFSGVTNVASFSSTTSSLKTRRQMC